MTQTWRLPLLPSVVVVCAWIGVVAALATLYFFDQRIIAAGRGDLAELRSTGAFLLAPILSSAAVGSVLIIHRPRHPVGWLFLCLALVILGSGIVDSYALYGAVVRPGSLPVANMAAVIGDASFIPWLVILALVLLYIPGGQLRGRAGKIVVIAALAGGIVSFLAALFTPYHGPLEADPAITNPLEPSKYSNLIQWIGFAALLALNGALLSAAAMLLVRFRTARGVARQQLRWMALASIAFPFLVVGAFVSAVLNNETVLVILAGCFVGVIPIAAGLAIEQDHLFDIDRLISRGLTYSLLTAFLVGCYAIVVVFVGESLSSVGGNSEVAVAVATLATVSIAGPARRNLQAVLDKRFNRREFDAMSTIRRFIRQPPATTSVEEALRQALGDEQLTIAYWIDDRAQWVSEDGRPLAEDTRGLTVERRGGPVARVTFDESRTERRVVEALLAEAGSEVENARLRAAITLQLREVKESRVRILAAQLEERRRLERNLHDGAQQRLLAVALQLRASEVSKDAARQSNAIDAAVGQLQLAVKELRDLANGLHPIALSDGGLAGAFEDLAGRTPILVLVDVSPERFTAELEEAAWFIACEAVANAVKHAAASSVEIKAVRDNAQLHLSIEDNGVGGADSSGHGIRGLADRAEAAGGSLRVYPRPGGGTVVRAELPCVS